MMVAVLAVSIASLSPVVAYLVLGGLIAVESAGVPLPGETALIAAGVLASRGNLSIEVVIAVAALGAILGDNVGFAIGRTGGRRLLERPGHFERQRHHVLARGEPFFERHGAKAVFLGRWVSVLRIGAAWLAGVNRMPWPRFLFWNALGGVGWSASVGLLAYVLGPAAERLVHDTSRLGIVAAALLGLVVLVRVRRARRADGAATR